MFGGQLPENISPHQLGCSGQAGETYAHEFREVSKFEHGRVRELVAIFVGESKTEPQDNR